MKKWGITIMSSIKTNDVYSFFYLKNYYYQQMKNQVSNVALFDFKYNGLKYSLLLSIHRGDNTDFGLIDHVTVTFAESQTQNTLKINLDKRFEFEKPELESQFTLKLKKFFNINGRKKGFHPVSFLTNITKEAIKNLRVTSNHPTIQERLNYVRDYELEEPNKIYFSGFIQWNKKKVTNKNRAKVQKLFPDIFEEIKNENISVSFTDEPKNAAAEKKAKINSLTNAGLSVENIY